MFNIAIQLTRGGSEIAIHKGLKFTMMPGGNNMWESTMMDDNDVVKLSKTGDVYHILAGKQGFIID